MLRGAMFANRVRRFQHIVQPSLTQSFQWCDVAQSRVPTDHENVLHPWVMRFQRIEHGLETGNRSLLYELPCRIQISMTSSIQPDERALLTAFVDRLTTDLQVFGDVVGRKCSTLDVEKSLALSQAPEARWTERILRFQRFDRIGLLKGTDDHLEVGGRRRCLGQCLHWGVGNGFRHSPERTSCSNVPRRLA